MRSILNFWEDAGRGIGYQFIWCNQGVIHTKQGGDL